MSSCQYKECKNEATTKGVVLARNPEGGEDTLVEVYACDKHKKTRGFFETENVNKFYKDYLSKTL